MSAGRLVGDPVVDNLEMLGESLGEGAGGLGDELLLALGAGDKVDQVAGLAVHPAVDLHSLTRHRRLDWGASGHIDGFHCCVRDGFKKYLCSFVGSAIDGFLSYFMLM